MKVIKFEQQRGEGRGYPNCPCYVLFSHLFMTYFIFHVVPVLVSLIFFLYIKYRHAEVEILHRSLFFSVLGLF